MATLSEIKNNINTIENISEEVFKYEMEISHLNENSEYYIINYNKIYTKKGYNYILKNADGNYYWANPRIKNFIEESKYPPGIEIKTHEYHKFIDKHGNTYLDENKKPILELDLECEKVYTNKVYKPVEKQVSKNKVVDDYYISRYIYGLKYTLDTKTNNEQNSVSADVKEVNNRTIPLTDIRNKVYQIKEDLKTGTKDIKDIKNKLDDFNKDTLKKLTEINEILECKDQKDLLEDVLKSHIENLEKHFKKYHEEHEIKEDIKFRFENLEKYVKEKYENETSSFIKFYRAESPCNSINESNKDKLKIQPYHLIYLSLIL